MQFNKYYSKPEIELIPVSEILTLKGSGEGNDNILNWDSPDDTL